MAITYRNSCEVLTDFTTVNANTSISANNGYTDSSLRIAFPGSAYSADGIQKNLPTASNIIQLRLKVASATTLSTTNGASILAAYNDTTYTNGTGEYFRFSLQGVSGNSAVFKTNLISPINSYAGDYSQPVTFNKNQWYTFTFELYSGGIRAYYDMQTTPFMSYVVSNSYSAAAIVIGELYQNDAGYITGNVDFDDILTRNLNTITTEQDRINDAIESYVQRYHSNGAIVRPIDPTAGQTSQDVVSEGIAYGLKLYAQNNQQTYFNETFTWAYNNMRRGSTPGGSPTTNTPTDAFFLYGYKYNVPGHVLADGNYALDADPEIAQALLWAHARWGSAGTVNYLARALEIIGDLRTYGFRLSTGTGYQYLKNDAFQTGATIQMGGDYDLPAGWRLFAQYDTANASFWNLAVSGSYDLQTKQANYVFSPQTVTSKLTPNWSQMTLATATISGTSTYGDSRWGYNSFRMHPRAYDDYRWYASAPALAFLQLAKSFLTTQYSTNTNKIFAEYLHDGTVFGTGYESSLFYYPYYYSLYAGDTGNTTASSIASTKFPAYTPLANGGYFGAPGYFGDSWLPIYRMQVAGTYNNYGQATAIITTPVSTALMMGI